MKRIDIAIEAAKEAGEIVKKGFFEKNPKTQTKSHANDLVTEYDLKAQDIIIAHIQKHFPDDEIIGEEKDYATTSAKTAWVIDPIDGTNPYSRKIETFGVVIGYMKDFKAQFCIVYNPILKKMYIAQKGMGATCNGEPIHIAQRPFENQLISVEAFNKQNSHYFKHLLNQYVYNVIGRSSSSYSTIMVASGQSDAFIGKIGKIWDRIHYIILVEAGAKLTNFKGEEYTLNQDDYIACHPKYHKKYIEIITKTLKEIKD